MAPFPRRREKGGAQRRMRGLSAFAIAAKRAPKAHSKAPSPQPLSRKRERGFCHGGSYGVGLRWSLLPQAGEGGAQRRMRGLSAFAIAAKRAPKAHSKAPSPQPLSRKRERGFCHGGSYGVGLRWSLLPQAGEGGAQRRMRGAFRSTHSYKPAALPAANSRYLRSRVSICTCN